MSIAKSIRECYQMKKERNWDTIYIAIDLHGTIIESGRDKQLTPYPDAKEVLQFLNKQKDIILILFTSTKQMMLLPFWNWCEENNIVFNYFNGNPECMNTHEGDYTMKFYYNLLLDDRAGFDPLTDWKIVKEEIEKQINQ